MQLASGPKAIRVSVSVSFTSGPPRPWLLAVSLDWNPVFKAFIPQSLSPRAQTSAFLGVLQFCCF